MDFTTLAAQYGPWVAAFIVLTPLFITKLLPLWNEERERQEAEHERQEQERRQDKQMLMTLVSQNTAAFTEMRVTLQQVTDQLGSMAEAQARLNEDVSGLYGHIGVSRPSRREPT